jgi:hypothetical protein
VTLLPFEIRWAATIARALVPEGALGGRLDAIDLGARYADECARSPWYAALVFRASLWLTWLAPLWLHGRPRTFGGLDGEARVALLERLFKHSRYNVRMMAMVLKLAVCSLLLGDEATLAAIGAYRLLPPVQLGKRSAWS